MDETEVTNAQFAKFVEATKYVTVAERVPDWEELKKQLPPGSEKPSPDKLVAGALVFTLMKEPPSRDDVTLWWKRTAGADWQHPEGPKSNITGREQHPVVQVAYDDALAYAKWEFAAHGGLEGKRYEWGDEFRPAGKTMANVWQGTFPNDNQNEDGFERSSPDFAPVPERIATFDSDGTLWSEQPMYFQAFFVFDQIKKMAATHSGMTTEEFEKNVTTWLVTAKHPVSGRPFTDMVYQPMLELLAYLRANGFKTFIVSGGGIEFMRVWTEKVYGIPPGQVVSTSCGLKYELRDGTPVIVKTPELVLKDDKEGMPVGIQRHIGRRPVMAFGNSDGHFQMLEWTTSGKGPRL